jgi:hypothetical protein
MEPKPKRQRPPSFRLELPGDDEVKQTLLDKLHQIKSKLNSGFNKCHNNTDVLEQVFSDWI